MEGGRKEGRGMNGGIDVKSERGRERERALH